MVVCCLTPKAEGSTVPSDTAGCARGCSSNWMTGDAQLQASQWTTATAASSATGHCVLVRGNWALAVATNVRPRRPSQSRRPPPFGMVGPACSAERRRLAQAAWAALPRAGCADRRRGRMALRFTRGFLHPTRTHLLQPRTAEHGGSNLGKRTKKI